MAAGGLIRTARIRTTWRMGDPKCVYSALLGAHASCVRPSDTQGTLEACVPRDDLCVLRGREKKCSAGFQPANGPVDAKGVIQAHMPARRRRYDSFSRPASLR